MPVREGPESLEAGETECADHWSGARVGGRCRAEEDQEINIRVGAETSLLTRKQL
jgi:hypothetical protein